MNGRETFLNSVEDMDWLFEVHLKDRGLTRSNFKSAILIGNEDCPSRVDLFLDKEPKVTDSVVVTVILNQD
jgi:hypothetical protein